MYVSWHQTLHVNAFALHSTIARTQSSGSLQYEPDPADSPLQLTFVGPSCEIANCVQYFFAHVRLVTLPTPPFDRN